MLITKNNLKKIIKRYLNEMPEDLLEPSLEKKSYPVPYSKIKYWKNINKEISYYFDWEILDFPADNLSDMSDMAVGSCSQNGCAQWVSDSFGSAIRIGNAWHADRLISFRGIPVMKYGSHRDTSYMTDKIIEYSAMLFSKINEDYPDTGSSGTRKDEMQNFAKLLIPDQSKFKNLELGDIVGLYYEDSNNFTRAFFESATGCKEMGNGHKETIGDYFVVKSSSPEYSYKEGDTWIPDMLGKKIIFKPSDKFKKNKIGFPVNTHIGVVGALYKDIPIIYHNVHETIHAVGLNAIDSSEIKIFWAASKE